MKKRILIAVPQLTGGGAERVATIWANSLYDMEYDVGVLAFYPKDSEYELHDGIEKYYVTTSVDEYLKIGYFTRLKIIREILKKFTSNCHFISSSYANLDNDCVNWFKAKAYRNVKS